MTDSPYSVKREEDALGITVRVVGPLMSQYTSYLRPQQVNNEWFVKCEADRDGLADFEQSLLTLLERAFEAGRRDKARELREALGVKDSHR